MSHSLPALSARKEAPGHGGWADLPSRLRAVPDAQHDLDTILTRPTLFDVADPVTAQLLRTLRICDQLPSAGAEPVPSWAAESAIGELVTSWHRARS
jgi:hypothetical protein